MKALGDGDSARAVSELQKAVEIYPSYYAARLALGRELRLKKRFREAEEVLGPLVRLAPGRVDPHIEYGIVLLELKRRGEAVGELQKALQLSEANWAAHLYAGWALLETEGERAAHHFRRSLELDERKAARAHLALARLAHERGERQVAVEHLKAYLSLAPDAPDAEATRRLAEQLQSPD
ncbi:MAG: tetratricopeptide repeat protein, partial [Pyrinomonadaceae bacterium]